MTYMKQWPLHWESTDWKLYRLHVTNSKLFCYHWSVIGSVVVVIGLYIFLWSKSKQIVECKIVKLPTSTEIEEKEEEHHNKIGRHLVIPMTPWSTTVNLLFHPERPTCPTNHLWRRKEKWSVDCYWNILSTLDFTCLLEYIINSMLVANFSKLMS